MRSNPLSKPPAVRLAVCAMAASAVLVFGVRVRAAEKKPEIAADESAIRASIQSYVDAYNRGDAKAVASHWSESGEWTSPSGERFQGKAATRRNWPSCSLRTEACASR